MKRKGKEGERKGEGKDDMVKGRKGNGRKKEKKGKNEVMKKKKGR